MFSGPIILAFYASESVSKKCGEAKRTDNCYNGLLKSPVKE